MKARLTKDFYFEASHSLPNAPLGHPCKRNHGHSFKIEISIEGEIKDKLGWIYDHGIIREKTQALIQLLDHTYLNEIEGLENPTIENLALWFWKKLDSQLLGLAEIVIHETPTTRCSYRGE